MDTQFTNTVSDQAYCSPAQLFIAMLNDQYKPAKKIIFLYKEQRERLFKNTAFYTSDKSEKGINQMKNTSFWRKLIEELIASKKYSITDIAKELDVSREIIAGLSAGDINCEPSFSLGIQLLELHYRVRSDLYK